MDPWYVPLVTPSVEKMEMILGELSDALDNPLRIGEAPLCDFLNEYREETESAEEALHLLVIDILQYAGNPHCDWDADAFIDVLNALFALQSPFACFYELVCNYSMHTENRITRLGCWMLDTWPQYCGHDYTLYKACLHKPLDSCPLYNKLAALE
jgi:hypothetical protein